MLTYVNIGINWHRILQVFRGANIDIQIICGENIMDEVFETLELCTNSHIKQLHRYMVGTCNYIQIQHNNILETKNWIKEIESICELKYDPNIKIHIVTDEIIISPSDYLWVYMIFMTILLILFRFKSLKHVKHNYLYLITSVLMAINVFILLFHALAYKYNVTPTYVYYHHKDNIRAIISYLSIMYIVDIIVLLLNIRKEGTDDKY